MASPLLPNPQAWVESEDSYEVDYDDNHSEDRYSYDSDSSEDSVYVAVVPRQSRPVGSGRSQTETPGQPSPELRQIPAVVNLPHNIQPAKQPRIFLGKPPPPPSPDWRDFLKPSQDRVTARRMEMHHASVRERLETRRAQAATIPELLRCARVEWQIAVRRNPFADVQDRPPPVVPKKRQTWTASVTVPADRRCEGCRERRVAHPKRAFWHRPTDLVNLCRCCTRRRWRGLTLPSPATPLSAEETAETRQLLPARPESEDSGQRNVWPVGKTKSTKYRAAQARPSSSLSWSWSWSPSHPFHRIAKHTRPVLARWKSTAVAKTRAWMQTVAAPLGKAPTETGAGCKPTTAREAPPPRTTLARKRHGYEYIPNNPRLFFDRS